MVGSICGGFCYMIGYWIIMNVIINTNDEYVPNQILIEGSEKDWILTIRFIENYLGGITVIIFGINCWSQILYGNKLYRIFVTGINLLIVSIILFKEMKERYGH